MYGFKKVIFGWLIGFWLLVGCFIGSHLVDRLVSESFDVVVLDDFFSGRENLNQYFGELGFCLVEGDIRDKVDVGRLWMLLVCPRVTEKREGLYAMLTMSS